MTTSTTQTRIQEIFNETIGKIINLVEPSNPGPEPNSTVPIDRTMVSADLIPILQTFLMNVQIYHTTTFNGIVNGISTAVPVQSMIKGDITQPSVSNRWASNDGSTTNTELTQKENELAGFAALELNDTKTIWPVVPPIQQQQQPPCYSNAAHETRKYWGSRTLTNHSNYDDFLRNYTEKYSRYNNTYVEDSSDGEYQGMDAVNVPTVDDEKEDAWQSLSEYISEMTHGTNEKTQLDQQPAETLSEFQCCARLSKYMKYRIADLDKDFVKTYPPDTYIEGGFVFGKPCINKVSQSSADKGNYLCSEHINDVGIEDIRQPRPEIHSPAKDDDSDIVFSNKGYYTGSLEKKDEWEGFDYYSDYDPNYYKRQLPSTGSSEAFSHNHQCCARLNKYRLYRLELESDKFLDTYPEDVYIEDGCVYGTACQNLISDESYNAGIRFCIEHESDPYVENICEPSIANTKITRASPNSPYHPQSSLPTDNESSVAESLGLQEQPIPNFPRRSSRLKKNGSYSWDKYNTDFTDFC
jgi:hypothetical protein